MVIWLMALFQSSEGQSGLSRVSQGLLSKIYTREVRIRSDTEQSETNNRGK